MPWRFDIGLTATAGSVCWLQLIVFQFIIKDLLNISGFVVDVLPKNFMRAEYRTVSLFRLRTALTRLRVEKRSILFLHDE